MLGVGGRVLLLSAKGLSARGRVLLAGAGCWVLMAGAEALAGAQWRVRIPGAVGGADIGCCWLGAEALTGAQCRVRIPGAGCCQKVLDRTMRLVKDFDYLCSPSSEGVSAP